MTAAADDPVGAVIEEATADLPAHDRRAFTRLMRAGLAEIDPAVGPGDLAVEIAEVTRIAPAERLAWAGRFAASRRVFRLQRRSFDLLTAFKRGDDVRRGAADLLAEAETMLAEARQDGLDQDLRHDLGEVALECRYILSGGKGPASLRTRKVS